MGAVQQLCNSSIILKNGCLVFQGTSTEGILEYQKDQVFLSNYSKSDNESLSFGNSRISVDYFSAKPLNGNVIDIKSGIRITIGFQNYVEGVELDISFNLKNSQEIIVFSKGFLVSRKNEAKKEYEITFDIPPYILNEGVYYFDMFWGINRKEVAYRFEKFGFEVLLSENEYGEVAHSPGVLYPNIECVVK